MNTTIGETLSELRKNKKLMQKELAARLSVYGFSVSAKTIYNWEKGLAQPSIPHFIALCDILDVDDVLWRFAGIRKGPYSCLNSDGRHKAREFIDLLLQVDRYRATGGGAAIGGSLAIGGGAATGGASAISGDDFEGDLFLDKQADPNADTGFTVTGGKNTQSKNTQGKNAQSKNTQGESVPPRILRLYDLPVSAGTGNFLDDSSYEEIEAPSYVPVAVDFALRVSGDSMEPLIRDGQVIWVKEQEVLDNGEIGIFAYSGDVYCKKLIADGARAYLRSLNPVYEDIEILEDFGFRAIGKVVS